MNPFTRSLTVHQPPTVVFGAGALAQCAADLQKRRLRRVFVVTSRSTRRLCEPLADKAAIWSEFTGEPTIDHFHAALSAARDARPDGVIGLGGGSALDLAKLVAAFLGNDQDIREKFGIDKLAGRSTFLACLPTTAGTGSEVSPNAILLDEQDQLKKGVVSPYLVPDAAYIDPMLTFTVPAAVTASTGMDAMTHCIEAYVNRLAHPFVELYALEGIRLIARSLLRAVENPSDMTARTEMSLGSLYGGMCLGPVNTGAVHALAYPLGGEFHIPHGLANAVLLPHVLEFNLAAAPQRYAQVASALADAPANATGAGAISREPAQAAADGLKMIRSLSQRCGIPARLRDLNIPEHAIDRMARSAMTITRLLERNVRALSLQDAIDIYRRAF
jgi:alcohol dehydrogenase class IV